MKLETFAIVSVVFCIGCEMVKVEAIKTSSFVTGRTPACSHKNMETLRFTEFPDGYHYLLKEGRTGASVSIKDGYLEGDFEIYYSTGIFKYKGKLDNRGHVILGKYNDCSSKEYSCLSDEYSRYVRNMTTADMKNAQLELIDLMNRNKNKFKIEEVSSVDLVQPKKMPTLSDCVEPESHPTIGNVYNHDGEDFEVFQVLKDGVMVSGDGYKLDFVVITSKGYVDDELLRPGKYEYVGPYTYETVKKKKRTIRCFKEVD